MSFAIRTGHRWHWAFALTLMASLVSGCAVVRAASPGSAAGSDPGGAAICAPELAAAHHALASAGQDPAAAHAAHAAAMGRYHQCLMINSRR